jgi:mycothiol synthase
VDGPASGSVRLRTIDLEHPDERDVRALHALVVRMRQEARPGDAPVRLDEVRGMLEGSRGITDTRLTVALAWDGERAVGLALVSLPMGDDNRHVASVQVEVDPDHRRRGIGRALARWALPVVREHERHLVLASTESSVPAGARFAEALGMRVGRVSHRSQLDLSANDERLFGAEGVVATWIVRGPERAPGYALEWLPRPVPDRDLGAYVAVRRSLNDAPRGTLETEDRRETPTSVRDFEALLARIGVELWTLIARQAKDGTIVGFSDLYWTSSNPAVADQGDTGVDPAHRGHGLGTWIKATMLERLRRERPDVRVVRTRNAESNAAMLAINEALGFVSERANVEYQARLEVLLDRA